MKTKLINGQKLPPQFRTARLHLEPPNGAADKREAPEVDEANRIVKNVSVSSDEPYDRYYGTEILSHEPGAVNLKRVTSGASPLLFNHQRDALIGKVSNPQLREGKLYVDFKFSQSEAGVQMLKDLLDGILTECSIGYDVDKFEVDEKEETYLATKWTLYECSLVSIPADFTVGVGRAFEQEEKTVEIEKKNVDGTRKSENNDSQERENRTNEKPNMDPTPTPSPAAPAAPVLNEKEITEKATAADRKRTTDILDLSKHFAEKGIAGKKIDTNAAALEHIRDGKTLSDFQSFVMKGEFKEVVPIQTPDNEGNIEVIGERGQPPTNQRRGLSIGAQFIRSQEVKAVKGKLPKGASVGMDVDFSAIGIRGKVALAQRAGFTSSDLSAVNVTIGSGILTLGVQRLTVMDVIGTGSIGTGSYKYARENGFGTIDGVAVAAGAMPRAKAVGERGLKPTWEPDLSTETANVSKIAITTKVPDEFLADFPSAMSYLDERLPLMVDTETEFQILYGDGLNNNLKGIFTTEGVQTRAVTTTDDSTKAASLRQGITDIQVGAQFEPDFFGFHPYDWETASLLKDDDKRFLAGGPFYVPYTNGVYQERYTFWGKPVVISTAISYGRPICGAGKLGAAALIREGMRIEMTNSNEDDFRRNLIALRAEHRLALPVYRPVAFLEFTGWPARA